MAAPDRSDLPWVLIRKGHPRTRHLTRELAQKFYDGMIHGRNGWAQPEAMLRGPNGEGWYRNGRHGEWHRDDDRRRRARLTEEEASA